MFSRLFNLTSVTILSLGFLLASCGLIKEKELLEGKVLYNQPYYQTTVYGSESSLSCTFEEGNILKIEDSDKDVSNEFTITEVIEKENANEYDISLEYKKGIDLMFSLNDDEDKITITVKVFEDKKAIGVKFANVFFPVIFRINNND